MTKDRNTLQGRVVSFKDLDNLEDNTRWLGDRFTSQD
jgi:hypothetical protein